MTAEERTNVLMVEILRQIALNPEGPGAACVYTCCQIHCGADNAAAVSTGKKHDCIVLSGEQHPDKNGDTPLHHAVRAGNTAVVDALFRRGADPLAKNNRGKSPWVLANALDPHCPARPLYSRGAISVDLFKRYVEAQSQAASTVDSGGAAGIGRA